jgi:hypothetical protein
MLLGKLHTNLRIEPANLYIRLKVNQLITNSFASVSCNRGCQYSSVYRGQ